MSDLIEPVGARLTLLNGPAFRAGLASATESLQAFNDEQERAAELASASQDDHRSRLQEILGRRRRLLCRSRRCRQG